jgi:hypothetical protein
VCLCVPTIYYMVSFDEDHDFEGSKSSP